VAELTLELTELMSPPSSDVMDARTEESVAVDSCDDRLAMALLASLVMELTSDEADELMDERAELREEVSIEEVGEVVVAVVVVWACFGSLS
jgi:hypothetical protein